MRNKLIVVTGGAGFIGSHIAWELVKDNEVIIIDNLYTGKEENVPPGGAKLVRADIRDYDAIAELISHADYVFHEAAQVSVVESVRDPVFTEEVNVLGTINVLRALLEGHGKLIFASSAAVYGDNPNLPLRETERPRPLSLRGHEMGRRGVPARLPRALRSSGRCPPLLQRLWPEAGREPVRGGGHKHLHQPRAGGGTSRL